jgi:hypothetical protein
MIPRLALGLARLHTDATRLKRYGAYEGATDEGEEQGIQDLPSRLLPAGGTVRQRITEEAQQGRRQPGSGPSLAGCLAGTTRLLKTLEEGRVGRPGRSVQGSRLGLKRGFGLRKIRVNLLRVRQIKRNRTIDLLERQKRKSPLYRLGRRAALQGVDNGVQRNTRARNPVSTVTLFDVDFFHNGPRVLAMEAVTPPNVIVPLIIDA